MDVCCFPTSIFPNITNCLGEESTGKWTTAKLKIEESVEEKASKNLVQMRSKNVSIKLRVHKKVTCEGNF